MKREAGGLGEFLLCPQGKAASPRFMGVIVLGDVCLTWNLKIPADLTFSAPRAQFTFSALEVYHA